METGVAIPKNIQSLIYDSLTNTSNEEHSLKTLSNNSEADASWINVFSVLHTQWCYEHIKIFNHTLVYITHYTPFRDGIFGWRLSYISSITLPITIKEKYFPVKENETHPPYYMHSDMFGKSSTTRECVDSRGVSVCILVSLYHINKQTKDTQDLQCFLKPNL